MSYGLPAITSTAGAAHEIITHSQKGFLVASGNIASITQPIQALQKTVINGAR